MALAHLLPWAYGALLVIVHYWGEEIADHTYAENLTPLAAGVTVSYVFLELLPRHHAGIQYIGRFGFFSVLLGFSALHVAEAFIVQHEKSLSEIRHQFKELHSVFLFLYYAAIGLLLHDLTLESVVEGTFFFVPILLHTGISSLSVAELHEKVLENRFVKAGITVSVLIGVALGALIPLGDTALNLVLGGVTGMFLYIVISDAISRKEQGDVRLFVLGLALYSLLISYTWLVA